MPSENQSELMPATASAPAIKLKSALAQSLVEVSYLSSQAAISPYPSELASKGSGVSLQLQNALQKQAAQLTKSAAAPEQAISAALPETLPAMQGQPMAASHLNAQPALSFFAARQQRQQHMEPMRQTQCLSLARAVERRCACGGLCCRLRGWLWGSTQCIGRAARACSGPSKHCSQPPGR